MAGVLLGWELGNGIGYARRLADIADRLAAAGHEPILALRDPTALAETPHRVVRAPEVVGRLRPGTRGFIPAGFADLMACNGFGSHDHLLGILRGWQELIDETRPALVLAEYAPALVLAAWRRIPTVSIGTPYLMPPAEAARFPEREGVRPYANQAAVLEVMRRAQDESRGELPERVTQPFAEAARIPYGFPELDPWSRHRRELLRGLWGATPVLLPPSTGAARIFAYLSPRAPGFAAAVAALSIAAITGEAFIPGCPAEMEAALAASGIALHRQPPALARVLAQASLIFHHGGMDTAQTALALGRPQLVLPRYLDQRLTGEALAALGIGAFLSRTAPAETMAAELRRLAEDATIAERALLRATLIRRRGIGDALAASVEAAQALLGTAVPVSGAS